MFARPHDPYRRGGDFGSEDRGPVLPPIVSEGYPSAELIGMLGRDNERMRKAGTKLAEAAMHVVREHDGTHRLALAVAEWALALANEGDRGIQHGTAESRRQAAAPEADRDGR